jgi:uncharacterized protein YjbJ (UPF0337 family)
VCAREHAAAPSKPDSDQRQKSARLVAFDMARLGATLVPAPRRAFQASSAIGRSFAPQTSETLWRDWGMRHRAWLAGLRRFSDHTAVSAPSREAARLLLNPGSSTGDTMSNASKRSEGAAEKLGGKIKGAVGKLINNEQMAVEGRAKEVKGRTKEEAAKSAERGKGKLEEATGAIKNRVGAVIDNEQMQAEGKLRELKGEARQKANR